MFSSRGHAEIKFVEHGFSFMNEFYWRFIREMRNYFFGTDLVYFHMWKYTDPLEFPHVEIHRSACISTCGNSPIPVYFHILLTVEIHISASSPTCGDSPIRLHFRMWIFAKIRVYPHAEIHLSVCISACWYIHRPPFISACGYSPKIVYFRMLVNSPTSVHFHMWIFTEKCVSPHLSKFTDPRAFPHVDIHRKMCISACW